MVNNRIVEDELENCDFIKVGLMFFVVLGHSMALWGPNGWFNQAPAYPSKILSFLVTWIGSFHIYGFALVSGYIYAYVKYEKKKYDAFNKFIKQKDC